MRLAITVEAAGGRVRIAYYGSGLMDHVVFTPTGDMISEILEYIREVLEYEAWQGEHKRPQAQARR